MSSERERTTLTDSSELLRSAVARMPAAPIFFNQEEWSALASYEGQVVSGDPEGHIPGDLEADDIE